MKPKYEDLINQARQFRRDEYERLSNIQANQLQGAINNIFNNLAISATITDAKRCIQISNTVYAYIKIRRDDFPRFSSILNYLAPESDDQVGIFVAFVHAKLLKLCEKNILQKHLEIVIARLKDNSFLIPTAHLLYFFGKYAPNSILLCTTQYTECTLKAIKHQLYDVRMKGYEILILLLEVLGRSNPSHAQPIALQFFLDAQNDLKVNNEETNVHGSYLIIAALLEYSPQTISNKSNDLMNFFYQAFRTSKIDYMRCITIYNIILLSQFNPETFCATYSGDVLDSIWMDFMKPNHNELTTKSLLLMLDKFPFTFQNSEQQLFTVIKKFFSQGLYQCAFAVLQIIAQKNPQIISSHASLIAEILSSNPISSEFVEVMPNIFSLFPELWHLYIPPILTYNVSIYFLDFLAQCPIIKSEQLISRITNCLYSENASIRSHAPAAILNQVNLQKSCVITNEIFRKLFSVALSDPVASVRASIVRSFSPRTYKYLVSSDNLECLTTLSKDTSHDVRDETIILLGNIVNFDPFDVLPVLQAHLIDSIYLLDSDKPQKFKEGLTRSFLHLFKASVDILPIYCPTFCDIVLRQLSIFPTESRELTFFEQQFADNISLNLMSSIRFIADTDLNYLSTHLQQLVNFFIWNLQQHGTKELKLAIVKTIYTILTKAHHIPGVDIYQLFSALLTVASKYNSRKMNYAVLKLTGFIGAIDQNFTNIVEGKDEDESLSPMDPLYFMTCSCKTLLAVLADDSLLNHHQSAIKALAAIFCCGSTIGSPFFGDFMPILLKQVRNHGSPELISILIELCAEAPPQWIEHFADELLELAQDMMKSPSLTYILDLIPVLTISFEEKMESIFKPSVIYLIESLMNNRNKDIPICHKILKCLISMRTISNHFMGMVFPDIINIMTMKDTAQEVRIDILNMIKMFVQNEDCSSYSALIVRSLVFAFNQNDQKMIQSAYQVLYSLMIKLNSFFTYYKDQIDFCLENNKIITQEYQNLCKAILIEKQNVCLDDCDFVFHVYPDVYIKERRKSRRTMNEKIIMASISMKYDETPWNWKEWYRQFVTTVITQSPSVYISSCAFLCSELFNIAETLFNPAFYSLWKAMTNTTHIYLSACLARPFLSETLPGEIRSSLVNLLEFMERNECHIQISKQVLCQTCERSAQITKALYFAQRWYGDDPHNLEAIETLVRLYSHLGIHKTVIGIQKVMNLKTRRDTDDTTLKDALRDLKNQNKWNEIVQKVDFDGLSSVAKREVASIYATALFNLKDIDRLPQVLDFCNPDSVQNIIIKATYQYLNKDVEESKNTVEKGFKLLAYKARGAFKNDKASLYPILIRAQQLHELTEIHQETPEVYQIWDKRLKLCRKAFDVYSRILSIHLVKPIENQTRSVLKLLKLTLDSENMNLFENTITLLFPDRENWPLEISFMHAKGTWASGNQRQAIEEISQLMKANPPSTPYLKSRMYYTYGQWLIQMTPPRKISHVLKKAADFLETSMRTGIRYYPAWHRWSWACSVMYYTSKMTAHAVSAIQGFLECIKMSDTPFSDLIQMISLFFLANLDINAFKEIGKKIYNLKDKVLLEMIPQLLTQFEKDESKEAKFVSSIILKLLPQHFHVILYRILFISDPPKIVQDIILKFSEKNIDAVQQASIISHGLQDCATSTIEEWIKATLEAIKALRKNGDEKSKEIMNEALELEDQKDAKEEFRQELIKLSKAPDAKGLTKLHFALKRFQSGIKSLSMHDVAPQLAFLRNSILSVPGTYAIDEPLITITQFDPILEVYHSKQSPRFIIIYGSDGSMHKSLLKGSEDLRLDERVMQFFELINQHVSHDFRSQDSRGVRILSYSITPLSPTAGLIQFVNGADTIYSLITEYRTQHGISIYEEQDILTEAGPPNVDTLTPMQRVEMLQHVIDSTNDTDLREVLWLKSPSSREWVFRSVRFTQSNAIMSIIGNLLGLGDRHPSNLLIHRYSGSIIHIDFSDCFEIAKNRIIFPELVPFRLTRMMIRAFGPSGIEGNFRLTCQDTVRMCRLHRDSIAAVLDIFLQQPLSQKIEKNAEDSVPLLKNEDCDNSSQQGGNPISIATPDDGTITNMKESLHRITDKIVGYDQDGCEMTVEKQVDSLIVDAIDIYNLAHLYHGWTPLW